MRFLILAFAWTFIASPVSGQVQQKILQRAEQANASIQTRLGHMYDLGRNMPQNDTADGSWKRILIGAGIRTHPWIRDWVGERRPRRRTLLLDRRGLEVSPGPPRSMP